MTAFPSIARAINYGHGWNDAIEAAAKELETHMPDPLCHVSLKSAAAIVRDLKRR